MTAPEMLALYTFLVGWWLFAVLVFTWPTVPARIVRSVPLWLAYSALALVLDVIGLVLIALLSASHAWRARGSYVYDKTGEPLSSNWRTMDPASSPMPTTAWRGGWLTWLWGNEEDGVTGPTWWSARNGYPHKWWPLAWQAYRWSALRNPSNNLRFIPGINPVLYPARIHSWTWATKVMPRPGGWPRPALLEAIFTWQGVYSGIRLHIAFRGSLYRFWWGWKLKPEDAQGVPATDMRAPRCGFGTQFKRVGP